MIRRFFILSLACLAASPLFAEPVRRIDAAAYPSLQAAVNALPPTGGVVIIPAGEHVLMEPLIIKGGEIRITGDGPATRLINKNEQGQPAISIRPPADPNAKTNKKPELWRVQIDNLRLSGNPKSGDGIYAERTMEILLRALSIDHHGGNGVTLDYCLENPRVNDCSFTYNAKAGLEVIGCHDIIVNGSQFEENQDGLRCKDGFNLTCNGNNIDDHLRHGIVIENTAYSVCSGNMIEECRGTGVILDADCFGITVSANIITHHLGGGIDLVDANGCAISANTFMLCHGFAVRLGKESGRNSISANTFANSHVGTGGDKVKKRDDKDPMQNDTGSGIVIEGAKDLTITGNSFSGLETQAVNATGGASGVLVSTNKLTDCARKLSAGTKWIDLGDATESMVKDNLGAN